VRGEGPARAAYARCVTMPDVTNAAQARNRSQRRRLSILLALNVAMIASLLIVGFASHSLGVLAAGGDYVADSTAIGLGILSVTIRDRVGEHSKVPTAVAALNASALLVVSVIVFIEGARRLTEGTPSVHGLPVLIVSAVATAVMVAGVLVLTTGSGAEDLHMRSVLLDTVSDALASAAVAVSGLVIYVTGRFYWLDSALSVVIAIVIAVGAGRLLHSVVRAWQNGQPLEVDDD
jgi:cobalt-zinc-cadmium efflux system protein